MSRNKKRKLWSWSAAERPFKVRVTELKPEGNLYVVRIRDGRQVMRSLRHKDRTRAKAKAMEISAALARGSSHPEKDFRRRPLCLGELSDAYEDHGLHGRSDSYRRDQPRRLRIVGAFLGRDREVLSISKSDVRRYSAARQAGTCGAGRSVRVGTIWGELKALKICCAWATRHRVSRGQKFLPENPMAGISIPHERNPRRPVATEERYLALKEIAPELDLRFPLALDLAWSSGHRIGAILKLTWDDIDFSISEAAPLVEIRWRSEHDKARHEHVVPLNPLAFEALSRARRESPGIGNSWIFPPVLIYGPP